MEGTGDRSCEAWRAIMKTWAFSESEKGRRWREQAQKLGAWAVEPECQGLSPVSAFTSCVVLTCPKCPFISSLMKRRESQDLPCRAIVRIQLLLVKSL